MNSRTFVFAIMTSRFVTMMDKYLPDWRRRRAALNEGLPAHATWPY